jgi:hypothetical protein
MCPNREQNRSQGKSGLAASVCRTLAVKYVGSVRTVNGSALPATKLIDFLIAISARLACISENNPTVPVHETGVCRFP